MVVLKGEIWDVGILCCLSRLVNGYVSFAQTLILNFIYKRHVA